MDNPVHRLYHLLDRRCFLLSDSFSCAAVRTDAGNLAVSLDIATHLSEQYTNMTRLLIDKLKNLSQR